MISENESVKSFPYEKGDSDERERLARLNSDVILALVESHPLSDSLRLCAAAVASHLDAAFARIWTFNNRVNTLELQVSAGIHTHLNGAHARIPIGEFKIGRRSGIGEFNPHILVSDIGLPEEDGYALIRRVRAREKANNLKRVPAIALTA